MSTDKCRAAAKAIRHPRGVQVMAWGTSHARAVRRFLRCHPSKDSDIRNSMEGSSVIVRNAIAAMFIATGS